MLLFFDILTDVTRDELVVEVRSDKFWFYLDVFKESLDPPQ